MEGAYAESHGESSVSHEQTAAVVNNAKHFHDFALFVSETGVEAGGSH